MYYVVRNWFERERYVITPFPYAGDVIVAACKTFYSAACAAALLEGRLEPGFQK